MQYSEADRKRRKRKKKHYFRNFAIAVLVIAFLYYLAFYSGVFDVQKITVSNNTHYTVAQVAELSGVVQGDNVFWTRASAVAEQLEQDPYIRSADVKWALPDGIDISIDERAESALIAYPDGYVIADYDGVVLRLTADALVMPVIEGLTPVSPEAGAALKVEEAGQLRPGLDFLRYVEENDFYIKKLDLGGVIPKAYVFDRLIIEGELANMEKGMEEIKRVVADLDAKGIERGTISAGSEACSFSPEIRTG